MIKLTTWIRRSKLEQILRLNGNSDNMLHILHEDGLLDKRLKIIDISGFAFYEESYRPTRHFKLKDIENYVKTLGGKDENNGSNFSYADGIDNYTLGRG